MSSNIILSEEDINRLINAYGRVDIRIDYIKHDVKSIMENENFTKEKAIERILEILKIWTMEG